MAMEENKGISSIYNKAEIMDSIPVSDMPQVVGLGNFDGVHRGHILLIEEVLRTANRLSMTSAILTLYPHPIEVLSNRKKVAYLTTLEDRVELIRNTGIERVYIQKFTKDFSEFSPYQFVKEILDVRMKAKALVCGFNYRFGKDREGDTETLRKICKELGIDVNILSPVILEKEKVASTIIREMINKGDIVQANRYLGRTFRISGRVQTGDGRGKSLGYPTANIEPVSHIMIPADGVYAVRCIIDRQVFDGVCNIGCRPTFKNTKETNIEVHIFKNLGNIYGKEILVDFVAKIRSEKRYKDKEQLISQISRDIKSAKGILN